MLSYMAILTMTFISIFSISPFLVAAAALNATCYPSDLAALRAFAASFPAADFSDWDASDDCCAWGYSVTCSSASTSFLVNASSKSIIANWRRVTGLSLYGNDRFPSSSRSGGRSLINPDQFPLCRLSALYSLKLWGGWLSGPIPHCIGTNLTNLVDLELTSNFALTGPIPPSFSCLRSLQSLSLHDNRLSGPFPSFLSDALLPNLTFLSLSSNSFSGSLLAPFNAPKLYYLTLHSNFFSGSIPAFDNCSHLVVLDLSQNSFSGSISGLVAPALRSLDLSFNSLSGNMPALSLFPYLTYLHLLNNTLAGSLTALLIDVTNRSSSGEVICATKLIDLDVSHNSLSGHIPPSLGHCIARRIKLNHNNLEGIIPSHLFENNTTHGLEILSLSNNQLRGEIPPSLKELKHLKLLDLGHNKLQGNLEATLFNYNASDQFLNLRVLVLGDNRFTGFIPASLGSLMPALQVIDMSNNQISGLIPESLHDLPSFRIVETSQSSLAAQGILYEEIIINVKGSILSYQYVLRLLTSIDFSDNNLSGPIPAGLGALSGLFFLNFSRNKLSGQIPSDLGMLGEQLQSLDLSFNELVGPIPANFVTLTKLAVFDVSYNKGLCGSIPTSPQFEIAESYIGDPNLCGMPILPPCSTIRNCTASTQTGGATPYESRLQQSSLARLIDEWISIPGLGLGIVVGFVGTWWVLVSYN